MMRLAWVGFVVAGLAVAVYLRRGWLAREGGRIDAAIAARGYRYTYTGHDDDLRKRTEQRRAHAAAKKRDGRQIETQDDRASKIHIVGGGR